MFRQDAVEVLVVACFLVVHVLHQWAQVGVCARYDGRLGGVDEDGGELAGLVDAQGRGEEVALLLGEGTDGLRWAIF